MEELVTLHSRPANNHGCHGSGVVLRPISEREAHVVSVSACSVCVGNAGRWEASYRGKIVAVPEKFWGDWEYWSTVEPIEPSFSLADETRLLPRQLDIIGNILEEEEAHEHAF